jgi:hypothetical protein
MAGNTDHLLVFLHYPLGPGATPNRIITKFRYLVKDYRTKNLTSGIPRDWNEHPLKALAGNIGSAAGDASKKFFTHFRFNGADWWVDDEANEPMRSSLGGGSSSISIGGTLSAKGINVKGKKICGVMWLLDEKYELKSPYVRVELADPASRAWHLISEFKKSDMKFLETMNNLIPGPVGITSSGHITVTFPTVPARTWKDEPQVADTPFSALQPDHHAPIVVEEEEEEGALPKAEKGEEEEEGSKSDETEPPSKFALLEQELDAIENRYKEKLQNITEIKRKEIDTKNRHIATLDKEIVTLKAALEKSKTEMEQTKAELEKAKTESRKRQADDTLDRALDMLKKRKDAI